MDGDEKIEKTYMYLNYGWLSNSQALERISKLVRIFVCQKIDELMLNTEISFEGRI